MAAADERMVVLARGTENAPVAVERRGLTVVDLALPGSVGVKTGEIERAECLGDEDRPIGSSFLRPLTPAALVPRKRVEARAIAGGAAPPADGKFGGGVPLRGPPAAVHV